MNLRDLKTVTIKPGTFLLGSQIQREPRTKVIITRGFDMLTTPVTQELFLKVMGENPSAHQGAAGATTADEDNTSDNLASMRAGTFRLTGDNALCRPVENVSWLDAIRFCNTLSKLSRLDASLYNRRRKRLMAG